VNSPETVKLLTLPRIALRFGNGTATLAQEVPDSPCIAGPVSVSYATAGDALGEMRADKTPLPITTRSIAARLGLYGGAAAAIVLYFAYVRLGTVVIARRDLPF